MSKVYIILPVYNRIKLTRRFVKCLKSQTHQNYHLILVDDGSIDNTEAMVKSQIKSVTVLKGKGNWWWAGSLQQGINWLKNNAVSASDLVLMINNDVTFDKHFLEKAIAILTHKQHTLLQALSFSKQTGRLVEAGVKADLKRLKFTQTTIPEETNCLSTRSLFMRFSDLNRIGNFYPELLPHYLSDYEFTIRAHKKGLNLLINSELKIVLNESTTGVFQSGFEKLKNERFSFFLKKYFSKRSKANPIYFTIFILLTCPKVWIPLNIIKVWKWSATIVFKQLFSVTFPSIKI